MSRKFAGGTLVLATHNRGKLVDVGAVQIRRPAKVGSINETELGFAHLGVDGWVAAAVLQERLGPHRVLLAADGGAGQRWLAERAPWLAEMRPIHGRAAAYLCENFTCQSPVTEPAALRELLSAGK